MSLAIAEFFAPEEFASHDGAPYPPEWDDRWTLLVLRLCDPIRRLWGASLRVVSGYRTEAWNQHLIDTGHHPEAHSHHLEGRAADLTPEPVDGEDGVLKLHDVILRAYEAGQFPQLGGLGLYPTWIHVDTVKAPDGHLRRWNMR